MLNYYCGPCGWIGGQVSCPNCSGCLGNSLSSILGSKKGWNIVFQTLRGPQGCLWHFKNNECNINATLTESTTLGFAK